MKPNFAWKWFKWTFGCWVDLENKTYFGIDLGPFEITWRAPDYCSPSDNRDLEWFRYFFSKLRHPPRVGQPLFGSMFRIQVYDYRSGHWVNLEDQSRF